MRLATRFSPVLPDKRFYTDSRSSSNGFTRNCTVFVHSNDLLRMCILTTVHSWPGQAVHNQIKLERSYENYCLPSNIYDIERITIIESELIKLIVCRLCLCIVLFILISKWAWSHIFHTCIFGIVLIVRYVFKCVSDLLKWTVIVSICTKYVLSLFYWKRRCVIVFTFDIKFDVIFTLVDSTPHFINIYPRCNIYSLFDTNISIYYSYYLNSNKKSMHAAWMNDGITRFRSN